MITKDNYEEYMMLLADGELSTSEIEELKAFVKGNKELEQEMEYWLAARIVPDATEIYMGKEQLLKKGGGLIVSLPRYNAYGIAAGIILLICLGVFRWQGMKPDNMQVVKNDTAIRPQKPQTENSAPKPMVNAISPDTNNKKETIALQVSKKTGKNIARPRNTKADVPAKREDLPVAKKEDVRDTGKGKTIADTHKVIPIEEEPDREQFGYFVKRIEDLHLTQTTVPKDSISSVAKPRKNFLARLPFVGKRNVGLNLVSDAISEKVDKVNRVKQNLKNTNIKIKIGNKELLAFNL